MIEITQITQEVNLTVEETTNVVNIDVVETSTPVNIEVAETGLQGAGVPSGGTAGQKLVKVNSDDFNTQWVDDNSSTQNIFIQKTQPTASGSWIWYELNNDNSIKTVWINT